MLRNWTRNAYAYTRRLRSLRIMLQANKIRTRLRSFRTGRGDEFVFMYKAYMYAYITIKLTMLLHSSKHRLISGRWLTVMLYITVGGIAMRIINNAAFRRIFHIRIMWRFLTALQVSKHMILIPRWDRGCLSLNYVILVMELYDLCNGMI